MNSSKKEFIKGAQDYVKTVENVHHIQLIIDKSLLKEYYSRCEKLVLPQYNILERPQQCVSQFQMDLAGSLVLGLARRTIRSGDVIILTLVSQTGTKLASHKIEDDLRKEKCNIQRAGMDDLEEMTTRIYLEENARPIFSSDNEEQPKLRQRVAFKGHSIRHYPSFPNTRATHDTSGNVGFTPNTYFLSSLGFYFHKIIQWFFCSARCEQ